MYLFSESDIIMPLAKDGYMCIRSSSTCLVYLPQEVKEKLTITTVTDTSIRPKLANNEILIAPVVCITTENPSLLLRKPAVVELKKIIELSDSEANNKVILLCANSESLEWKELGAECECRVLKDRVSFKVTHFSLYAVISRKPRASSTVRVKPASADTPTPDRSSTSPTELTIPELPGFKVQIPPFSVNANRETDITATILHDCLSVCSEDDRSRLASSCVELIPHDITFSKPVSISIPIPDYVQVKESHPNAKLQIWHTNKQHNGSPDQLDWNLVEHSISQDEEGRYVAIVSTEHFSWYKPLWDVCAWACSRFATSFGIQERCQVFMSQETRLQPSQNITFSIAVVFYPYKEDPEPLPCNYKYTLLDSGLLDLSVSNEDALQFVVELNEQLLPNTHKPITGSFVISSHQARHQKACMVSLDGKVELQPGLPIGGLTFGIKEKPEDTHQTLILMKVGARVIKPVVYIMHGVCGNFAAYRTGSSCSQIYFRI